MTAGVLPHQAGTGRTVARFPLAGLLLSAAVVPLASTTIAVALPGIAQEFAADPATLVRSLVSSYLVVSLVLVAPAGKLCDRWGSEPVLAMGQACFAAGALLGALAPGLLPLAAARVLMAIGGALLVPAAMATLRNATAPHARARLFGVLGAALGLAAAVGPFLGGILVDTFGWRAIFVVNLPLLAAAKSLVHATTAPPPPPRAAIDWRGSALLACALAFTVAAPAARGAAAAALLAGAVICFSAFLASQRRAADPVFDPALLRSAGFAGGAALVALHNWVMYALIFQLPFFFPGMPAEGAVGSGRLLLAMLLSMVAASVLGGRATERLGSRRIAAAGTLAVLGGQLLLAAVTPHAGASAATAALVLTGTGLGLTAPPAQALALGAVGRGDSGMAAGALAMVRYLGGLAGIALLGFLLGDTAPADPLALSRAHQHAVWLHCGVAAMAVACAAILPGRAAAVPAPSSRTA